LDAFGATAASVERFVTKNSSIMSTTAAGDILIHGVAPTPAEERALVAGLTCGRPSNPATGEAWVEGPCGLWVGDFQGTGEGQGAQRTYTKGKRRGVDSTAALSVTLTTSGSAVEPFPLSTQNSVAPGQVAPTSVQVP